MHRSIRYVLVAAAILFVMVGTAFYALFTSVVHSETGYTYNLPLGMGKQSLIADLNQKNLLPSKWLFETYVLMHPHAELKAGEYLFPPGSTPHSIWQQITTGHGLHYRSFILIPGWTFQQLRNELNNIPYLRHTTFTLTEAEIMQRVGAPEGMAAEGNFCPETYFYSAGSSDLVILKRAYQLMQEKLHAFWPERETNLPYNDAYQALIAASLVEKEAHLASERPIIAGVLINRLNQNMLLQFDPTVIYGMGASYAGKIYKSDLLADTPYNTYVHKGLPPTPIAMPSESSLTAVLHPAHHDYFYFVAKGDGGHRFSKTLEEHHQAVTLYRPPLFFNNAIIERYAKPYLSVRAVKTGMNNATW